MEIIRYSREWFLYFLFLIPILILIYWYYEKKKKRNIEKYFSAENYKSLIGNFSFGKKLTKIILQTLAILFLIIAISNPQIGTKLKEVKQMGVDIFIALDVSKSMLAEDIMPNRLSKAKLEIVQLVNRLKGDRIGMIVFAGESFVQFPLTNDYTAANMFLDVIDVDVVPIPGTIIGKAIEQAINSFQFQESTQKVLILITDGENNEGNVFDVAEEAQKKGVRIYTIGMGTLSGTPIPVKNQQGDRIDFKRDKDGNMILTKLDESSLIRIAEIGKGKYLRATNSQNEIDEIYKELDALQKTEFKSKQFSEFEDQFQYFIFVALFLLLVEVMLSENKINWKNRIVKLKETYFTK